jgi:anti-sigma regulatory factor (Ser/Thr protein kinase)
MRVRDVPGRSSVTEPAVGTTTDDWATLERCVWPAEPGQLPAMRADVYRRLAALDLPDEARHDLVLAMNEAATNAIEHAYCSGGADAGVEMAFWLDGGCLHITVVDRGTWQEPPLGPRERGFGLAMIRQLVPAAVIDHNAGGTRVVLQHPLESR